MRRSILILAAAGAIALVVYYLFVGTETFDEPQPVRLNESDEQRIRAEDGTVETWTYKKETLPESSDIDASPAIVEPPTGAAGPLTDQALNAWNGGDIRGAIALFEQAIATDPNDPRPHSSFGRRLTLMTDYTRALPLLLRASELRPDDPQAWLDLLTLYERSLQFQRAGVARQRARELAGDRAFVRNDQGAWLLEGATLP